MLYVGGVDRFQCQHWGACHSCSHGSVSRVAQHGPPCNADRQPGLCSWHRYWLRGQSVAPGTVTAAFPGSSGYAMGVAIGCGFSQWLLSLWWLEMQSCGPQPAWGTQLALPLVAESVSDSW